MNADTLYKLVQLELLGKVEFGLMHKTSRRPDRFLWLAIRSVEIKKGGILEGVSEHGASIEQMIEAMFDRLTQLPDEHYLVRDASSVGITGRRQALRWSPSFGSWVIVREHATARG